MFCFVLKLRCIASVAQNGISRKLSAKDMVVYDWEIDESSEQEDLIEIYDEEGELVRTYTAYEYEKLRSGNKL